MVALHPVSHREFVARLKKFGFSGPFVGGKHLYMIKGEQRLAIPNPHRREIGIALLIRILRQAGIDRNAWLHD